MRCHVFQFIEIRSVGLLMPEFSVAQIAIIAMAMHEYSTPPMYDFSMLGM